MSVIIKACKTSYINFECLHTPSQNTIVTDAPVDNGGNGSSFSPTDLLATAYLSCMLTIIDLTVKANNWGELKTEGQIEKIMTSNPRRIGELRVMIRMPASTPENQRDKLEKAARNCPVALSVSEGLITDIDFAYEL